MRIARTLPPAAAPIRLRNILDGFQGSLRGQTEIERFRSELQDYFQVEHCFVLSSGKAALTVILQSLYNQHPDRNQVLIPAFTCYSVPSAIVRAGLKVSLCDIDPETLDFNLSKLQENLKSNKKPLAVVCPHLFGLPANIALLRNILADLDITIIEDAAQAMGGTENKYFLGTNGDAGFFSLGRGKAFSTVQGGIILTDSDQLAKEISRTIQKLSDQSVAKNLKHLVYALALSALMCPSLFWLPKAIPGLRLGETIYDPKFPMDNFSSFQAGLARNWPKRISALQQVRQKNVSFWQKHLSRFPWLQTIYPKNQLSNIYPLIRYPVLIKNNSLREMVLKSSHKHGLGIMPSYPDSIDGIQELEIVNNGQTFPGAKECSGKLVTFPVHSYVTRQDRQGILNCLENIQIKYI